MIIQLCGLSGSGKTTIANKTKELLSYTAVTIEVIDGDIYRKELCADLGFSRQDRNENIRQEITLKYENVKTVFVDCDMPTLLARDTKGLYKRAQLPDGDPNKMNN